MYDPSQKVPIKVEIQINGVWIDVTQRGRSAGNVRIKHALSDGARQPETSTLDIQIGNDDGYLTEDDPRSPWYPHIGRGRAIRVSLTGILGSDAYLFTGEIDRMTAVYPGGDSSAMDIEAIGAWGGVMQDDEELRSALYRSIIGTSPGDFVPHDYWSGEDGRDSTLYANAIPGHNVAVPSGPVSWSVDGPAGSAPLPHLPAGTQIVFPIASYVDAGKWAMEIALNIPAVPVASTTILEVPLVGGPVAVRRLEIKPPGGFGVPEIHWSAYDAAGTLLDFEFDLIGSDPAGPTQEEFFGNWILFTMASEQDGGNVVSWLGFSDGRPGFSNIGSSTFAGSHQPLVGMVNVIVPAALDGLGLGHVAVFVDPAFDPFFDGLDHFSAFAGWNNERVTDRLARLYAEEQRTITIHGVSNARMGPQPIGTFAQVVTQCVETDGGLFFDDPTDIANVYRALPDLYNQDPKVLVLRGGLTPDTRPVWDNQWVRNQWTVSRIDGSSATVTNEEHVAKVGRVLKDRASLSLATDSVLQNQASWRSTISTTPGPRYPGLGINLRNADGALLAEQIVNLVPGDRTTIAEAAFPSQHPVGGADQMVTGWETTLDADEWVIRPVCVPYGRYGEIGVYGTAAKVDRYDSAHSTLASGVDADDTTLLVGTQAGHALWVTGSTAPTFPFDAGVAGVRLPVQAIADGISDGFGRVVANSWGTEPVSGLVWTVVSGAAADHSTAGSRARHNMNARNINFVDLLDLGVSPDVWDVIVPIRPGVVALTADFRVAIEARSSNSSNDWARWDIEFRPAGEVAARHRRQIGGVQTNFAYTILPFTYGAASVVWARLMLDADDMYGKVWLTNLADQPQEWTAVQIGGAAGVPAGSQLGMRSFINSANTNPLPRLVEFDEFRLLNPQRWTVARSADGVDKPLSAGDQVRLWKPARYAL